jgi:hypothetical protein
MIYQKRNQGKKHSRLGAGAGVLLFFVVSGCDGLLDVSPPPNVVDASRPIGLSAAMVGTTVDFFWAYDTGIVYGGKIVDEFVNSGTAPGNQNYDRRDVPTAHGGGDGRGTTIGDGFYIPQQRASFTASALQERIRNGDFPEIAAPFTDSPQYAQAATFHGFAKVIIGDIWCTAAFNGVGPEYTSAQVYGLAEAEFTQAINAARASTLIRQAALVGRARTRLLQGNTQGAVADARLVSPTFAWLATYSTNSVPERNRVHYRTWDFGNWSVGPAFLGLTIDDTGIPDPRVRLQRNPRPAFEPTQDLYAPLKVPSASSPLRIATGDEARYIIAEVVGGQEAVNIINEVRARYGITQQWVPSGTGPNEIRDKVIDERRRTLFLDGVRMGDVRRYLDRYGLDFFPKSTPQGFPMGNQTCLPLPDIERNANPGL